MSAAAGLAIAALVALWWSQQPARSQIAAAAAAEPAHAAPADPAAAPTGPAAAIRVVAPALPDEPPFRAQDFAVTSDLPDGPRLALRSSTRSDRQLAIELAMTEPLADDKRMFATVSVADALGNTVVDCTWRDVELTGADARRLDCDLPVGVALPLAISGHQRPVPSYIESPVVVATDKRVH